MDPLPILVVDDKPDMRTEIARQLNRSGFPVESASNGSEAVDKLRSAKYSLVITEEQMPGIRGLEVLNSVREISPQIPVVITTATGTVHSAVEAMRAGASDYLLKPFSFEVLEKTVRNTIVRSKGNGQSEKPGRRRDEFKAGREIITRNRKFEEILIQARGIAPSSAAVLIQGESGTGKELLAHFI